MVVAGPPRGVEGRAGGRPRRTEMLTRAPFRGMGVPGWARPGVGHGWPEPGRATGRAGGRWIGREREVLPCPWSARTGARSRLDFAGPRGVPWSPPRRPADLRRG